jgi:predicted alpha/beta hydrolase
MRGWQSAPNRASRAPDPGQSEEIEIRTTDGWSLQADVHAPGDKAQGVVVLAHALMARRSEFHRRGGGLARFLASRGWTAVSFDFRGHGGSRTPAGDGASYGYDDLVRGDLPAVMSFARSRARGRMPVIVLGHSLGGHTSLVAQGTGALQADALVGFGACPWVPELEPSAPRWFTKRAILTGMRALTRRVGRFPARALRRGSDDESRACIEDIGRFARLDARPGRPLSALAVQPETQASGGWASADGRDDYLAALARVRVPVLQVVSTGDRLECAPACGEALLSRCGGPKDLLCMASRDDGGAAPGHMGMVTSARVASAWQRVEDWMRSNVRPRR